MKEVTVLQCDHGFAYAHKITVPADTDCVNCGGKGWFGGHSGSDGYVDDCWCTKMKCPEWVDYLGRKP